MVATQPTTQVVPTLLEAEARAVAWTPTDVRAQARVLLATLLSAVGMPDAVEDCAGFARAVDIALAVAERDRAALSRRLIRAAATYDRHERTGASSHTGPHHG